MVCVLGELFLDDGAELQVVLFWAIYKSGGLCFYFVVGDLYNVYNSYAKLKHFVIRMRLYINHRYDFCLCICVCMRLMVVAQKAEEATS